MQRQADADKRGRIEKCIAELEMDDANSIIFFGFGLLGVRLLELLWQILKGKASGFEMPDEASEALEEARRGGLGETRNP